MIPIDNRTRWNGWYDMLFVLLNLRPAVKKYCSDYKDELEEDLLSFVDQKKLCTIKDFLAPFTRATLTAEGDYTSIDSTLFTMDVLIKHLQNQIVSNSSFLFLLKPGLTIVRQAIYKGKKDQESKDFLVRLTAAYVVLDKYYLTTDISPFYAASLILNPSHRTRYLEIY